MCLQPGHCTVSKGSFSILSGQRVLKRDRCYCLQSADATTVCEVIHSATVRLQTGHPGAFILISYDFNSISLNRTLSTFTQFVDFPTRENKTLDLRYVNVKEAYTVAVQHSNPWADLKTAWFIYYPHIYH